MPHSVGHPPVSRIMLMLVMMKIRLMNMFRKCKSRKRTVNKKCIFKLIKTITFHFYTSSVSKEDTENESQEDTVRETVVVAESDPCLDDEIFGLISKKPPNWWFGCFFLIMFFRLWVD